MTKIRFLLSFFLFVFIVRSASSSAFESPCPIIAGTCPSGTVLKRACGYFLRCPCCVSL
ncbi:hypothetical protein MKX01_039843 [Papaver californicum]|nr:hypothetical protein MKX01_039843 [Papaver californicum]